MKNKINFPNYAYFSTENEGEIYWFPGRNVFVSCPLRSGSGQNIEQTERFPFFSFFFFARQTDMWVRIKNKKKRARTIYISEKSFPLRSGDAMQLDQNG